MLRKLILSLFNTIINLKRSTLFFLFLSLPGVTLALDCDFNQSKYSSRLVDFSQINELHIKVKKNRSWNKNNLSILVANREYSDVMRNFIPSKYKKKYSAEIEVTYPFGKCKVKSKIRQHGDYKDHIKLRNGKVYQSLSLDIREDNIGGVVGFRLLLPETRNFDNEIIASTILREIGILAPRTKYVYAKVNDSDKVRFIMQEKLNKEFLENSKKRESVIFEGDESFVWENKNNKIGSLNDLVIPKVINSKWIKKGSSSASISNYAYSLLLDAYSNLHHNNNNIFIDHSLIAQDPDSLKKFKLFEILLMSNSGGHGLSFVNRRYFWEPLNSSFEPIYYDGNLNFKTKFDSNYLFSTQNDIEYYSSFFSRKDFDNFRNIISKIKIDKLTHDLNSMGIVLTTSKTEEIILNILNNSKMLENFIYSNSNKNINSPIKTKNAVADFKKVFSREIKDVNFFEFKKFQEEKILVEHCIDNNCEKKLLSLSDFSDLLKRRYLNQIFLSSTFFDNAQIQTTIDNGMINIVHSPDVEIKFLAHERKLLIKSFGSLSWLAIKDSNIKDLKISFHSNNTKRESSSQTQRMNFFNITGCLNIYNSKLSNVEIDSSDAQCEDSINIVNSSGHIGKISVKNAISDAIDIDFSKLEIDLINVNNALNDCFDISYSEIILKGANLNECNDKAISVGESSSLFADNVLSSNSLNGIASKDSSETFISNSTFKNIKEICLSAYRKKQEFYGSNIAYRNVSCINSTIKEDSDVFSTIKKKN